MSNKSPRIVSAVMQPHGVISITWDDGVTCAIDLSDTLPNTAKSPRIDDWGFTLAFEGTDMDYSSPDLYKRAAWQSDRAPRPEAFREWRKRIGMTQEQLATALEMGRRTIGYYEDGTLLVPRVVTLAMKGLEIDQHRAA